MNNIFLLLSLTVGLASGLTLCPPCIPMPWFCPSCPQSSSPAETLVDILCSTITTKPTVGKIILTELAMILNNGTTIGQMLPKTVAYAQNLSNQEKLMSGGTGCMQFFVGIETAFFADLGASTPMINSGK